MLLFSYKSVHVITIILHNNITSFYLQIKAECILWYVQRTWINKFSYFVRLHYVKHGPRYIRCTDAFYACIVLVCMEWNREDIEIVVNKATTLAIVYSLELSVVLLVFTWTPPYLRSLPPISMYRTVYIGKQYIPTICISCS